MKLVSDAIRDILIYLENENTYEVNPDTGMKEKKAFLSERIADALYTNNSKYTYDEITYAVEKMVEDEYLITTSDPVKDANGNYIYLEVNDISMKGHELLCNIHDDTVWKAIQKRAKSMGNFSLNILSSSALTVGSALMNDPHAIDNFLKGVDHILKMIK